MNPFIRLSARIIPGNERPVLDMVSECHRKDVTVITPKSHPGIHVSGHAHQEDLIWLLKSAKPKTYIPVHGTFTHLKANSNLSNTLANQNTSVLEAENGAVFECSKSGTRLAQVIPTKILYLDGSVKSPLEKTTLNQRLKIGYNGLVLVFGTYDSNSKEWISPFEIEPIGISFGDAPQPSKWVEETKGEIMREIEYSDQGMSQDELNEQCRLILRRKLKTVFHRKIPTMIKITKICGPL